jgi:hypothetical protein
MDLPVPRALRTEHQDLHRELRRLTQAGGRVGEAARRVAELLHPHFAREEDWALPPLAALVRLAQEPATADLAPLLARAERLRAELPRMLEDHRRVMEALRALKAAARAARHAEALAFADRLRHHAEVEEQVLYPAAVLVGEYLRARLGPTGAAGTPTPPRTGGSPGAC